MRRRSDPDARPTRSTETGRRPIPHHSRPTVRVRVRIRRGREADLGVLVSHRIALTKEVELARLRPGADVGLPSLARTYRRWLRDRFRDRTVVAFVATIPHRGAVGSSLLWLRESMPRLEFGLGRQPRIHGMYVEPAFRRQGIAARLLEASIRWTRDHRHPRITLETSPMAEPLYRKFGFRPVPEMRLILPPR